MVDRFEGLSITNEEDEELLLEAIQNHDGLFQLDLCVVGRFLTERPINFMAMRNRIASIWRPGRGVNITDLGSRIYMFQFFHEMDVQRIMESGPWSFDNQFLLLRKLSPGDIPKEVPLFTLAFWVQVHDLPVGYMSECIGKQLGNFIGSFLEYDGNNNSTVWRNYMRIRVMFDVRGPLKRYKKIRNAKGDSFTVNFKYEKLNSFCFVCGMLGHTDKFCDIRFSIPEDKIIREWGPWLRAPTRGTGEDEGEKWLRNDQGGFLGNNKGNSSKGIPEIMHTLNIPADTANQALMNKLTSPQSMENLKLPPQFTGFHTQIGEPNSPINLNLAGGREDHEMEIMEERKRRRGQNPNQAQQKVMEVDRAWEVTEGQYPNGPKDNATKHELRAGPGIQACPEQ